MPTIRLVATDIDGTLADPTSQITGRTLCVLHALHAQDIEIALVTGLNPWVARRYADAIAPWARAVCLNGIFTLNHSRPVPGMYIDPQIARTTATLMRELGYTPLVFGDDLISRYLPGDPESVVEIGKLVVERPFQPYSGVGTLDELFSVPPAQVSICDRGDRAARLYPILDEALGDDAYIVLQPGQRGWVEVSHPEARKDLGLLALAGKLGIAPDEILYFGDSLNDLPVFERLPYSVAMANARPEIRGLAWRITASNAEDGVARFLADHFGLHW
ncbi:MAG: HAD family phosphatase [Anaerolineae bacterium]|nr:HAD family phosphatase [Anaerolineae bacterium]